MITFVIKLKILQDTSLHDEPQFRGWSSILIINSNGYTSK